MYNVKKREPTSGLLKKAHFLPVAYRIKYKLCMIAHKSIIGESPHYIQEELKLFVPSRSLRVGRDVFSISTKGLQKNTLSARVAEEWNVLPFETQATLENELFAKKLKTFLFKSAFNC